MHKSLTKLIYLYQTERVRVHAWLFLITLLVFFLLLPFKLFSFGYPLLHVDYIEPTAAIHIEIEKAKKSLEEQQIKEFNGERIIEEETDNEYVVID